MQTKKQVAAILFLTAGSFLLLASAAGAQDPASETAVLQQRMRDRLDLVLGMNINAPTAPQGFPVETAMSSIKLDPKVQEAINARLMKIMEQTIKETFSDARMMQNFKFKLQPPVAQPLNSTQQQR
jgi:hypothetical protein